MPLDEAGNPTITPEAMPVSIDRFLAAVERRAFRFAELALGQRDDALDCVQDTMLKFVGYQQRPAMEWTPLFWTILRRQITDRHRRNHIKQRLFFWQDNRSDDDGSSWQESIADDGPDPEQALVHNRAWHALGMQLRSMPRRQREAFMLRELEGLDVDQTAAAMGCSQGSVKTHLFRAHEKLRTALEDWR